MSQRKFKVTCATKNDEKSEAMQTSDAKEGKQAISRANQHQKLVISVLLFTIIAWLVGKADISIFWIFTLALWILFWWNNAAAQVIDSAVKEAEIDKRRQKALSNGETAEWLNFLINRWFVFSDRSLLTSIKRNLEPILEAQNPSYVGSIEILDFTLGNRTPYIKYVTSYDNSDDQRNIKASELNFNHPPDDLMTRGKYQAVIHLEAGLTSPEARFVIRIRLGNKGFLGTCTDVAVEDLHIHGKLQLVLLFNHNIPFPHLAAVTFFFIEEPDVSFNIRLLKAVQLMEFPLLRQWITQMVNDYLKLALVDPGHITIPFCDDPEVVGRGAAYDDPYWCSVKIDGQKRYTKEVTGDNQWSDHVSLLVYNLHADRLVIKLKGRRKLGTKYTVVGHVLILSKFCLESSPQHDQVLEKSSLKPATLSVQMEYTPLPVIDVCHSITPEDFGRNYLSRLRNLHPNEVSGVLLVCVHSGRGLVPMDKHGLSDPYCVIYENGRQAKRGEAVKGTLSPIWDTMVEILVADFTQTTLSFVILDKDTNSIKMIKDERSDFMGSCNLSLTEVSPVLFKKNLDLLYRVKGSGMMKAGKLCVSAIFRPVPSVAKSEMKESGQGLPEGEPPGQKDAKTEIQTLEALLRAERGSVEINIYQGRNLVAKDITGKSDPFVTVKDGSEGREKYRTRTITNTLEPVWSETAVVAMPDVNGLLLLEVWDKDPLTQERMGQIGFTTEKLKDLGKPPYEKHWYRLRGVKSGELQLAFKYTPRQADDDASNNNIDSNEPRKQREKDLLSSSVPVALSANSTLSTPVRMLHSSPREEKRLFTGRSPTSLSGSTQAKGRNERSKDEFPEVFTQNTPSDSQSRQDREEYELKAWPRKTRRLRSVVDTVRSLRFNAAPSVSAASSSTVNTSGPEEGIEQKQDGKDKSKSSSGVQKGNSLRKKFSFLKGRQRSISESHLSVLYSSHDDMDPLLKRKSENESDGGKNRNKKRLRRSSENISGSTTLSRQRSAENCFHSLPNSPVTVTSRRDRAEQFANDRDSRSTASCGSHSRGSSTNQDSCPMCDFNVLILSECPDCQNSQKKKTNSSFQERLIL
ncbi:Synaptotagmin-4 [Stylophora pistillata]|uniref:Synaptotagmin-4 n=1 Tax=Stylophora pistillata TaxID=50429 RepID=A0A2B4RQS0_STYPI|nr:Synaptotagmin-4 [Stylophora pistillata]